MAVGDFRLSFSHCTLFPQRGSSKFKVANVLATRWHLMRILCFSCLHSLTKHDLVLQILPRENKDLLYLYTIIVTIVTIIIIVSIILWLSLIGAHDVWQSRQSFVTSHTLHPCGGVRVERTAVSRGWSFSGHVRGEYMKSLFLPFLFVGRS